MGSGDLEIAGERESLDMFAGKHGPFGCCGGRLAGENRSHLHCILFMNPNLRPWV